MIYKLRNLTNIILFLHYISYTPILHAQLNFEIHGIGNNKIQIAIATFKNTDVLLNDIIQTIKKDLTHIGIFTCVQIKNPLSNAKQLDFNNLINQGISYLMMGDIQHTTGQDFNITYYLFDTSRAKQLSKLILKSQVYFMRSTAHNISDDIYEKLTGIQGIFSTYIAFTTHENHKYYLKVADADGYNKKTAFYSTEPIISLAWSPDGQKIAYVSFERKKPVVYIQNLKTHQRTLLANFSGTNSAPSWSPNGLSLAVALTCHNGLTQIYTINSNGNNLHKLTNTDGVSTEPQFSPDGQSIYFTSDHSGKPQIYKINIRTKNIQRITLNGNYNLSPRISKNGKMLAYISHRDGKFQLYVLNLTNHQEKKLCNEQEENESPSFAPNSQYILCLIKLNEKKLIKSISIDGQIMQLFNTDTQIKNVTEVTWGPFVK